MLITIPLVLCFSKTDTELFVTTQVATLQNGAIQVPEDTDGIIMEIGCSDRNTADNEILPFYPKSFLISFEPMLDKYSVLMSRGTERFHSNQRDKSVPLGRHHPRGVVLPFAVAPVGGQYQFYVSAIAGCSSLLHLNKKTKWGRWCLKRLENRTVDAISVNDAISLAPAHLPIQHLKLDVQGLDGAIIKAIPLKFLAKVKKIEFESFNPECNALYHTQIECPVIASYLKEQGFIGTCSKGCEPTSIFHRRKHRGFAQQRFRGHIN